MVTALLIQKPGFGVVGRGYVHKTNNRWLKMRPVWLEVQVKPRIMRLGKEGVWNESNGASGNSVVDSYWWYFDVVIIYGRVFTGILVSTTIHSMMEPRIA